MINSLVPYCIFGNIITELTETPNFLQSFLSICKVILEAVPSHSSPLTLLEHTNNETKLGKLTATELINLLVSTCEQII